MTRSLEARERTSSWRCPSFLDGCALSGLHSLRSFLDGCALSSGCALSRLRFASGLHSLRSFLDGCAFLEAARYRACASPRACIRPTHLPAVHNLSSTARTSHVAVNPNTE